MKSHFEGKLMQEPEDILQNIISKLLVIPKEDFFLNVEASGEWLE
jgi:hypothetical protein